MELGLNSPQVPAVRARDLCHQGEPHLRSGSWGSLAGRWRSIAGILSARRVAEPSRSGGALRNLRQIFRECRSEPGWSQLVDGGVCDGLLGEDDSVQLLRSRTQLRLRRIQAWYRAR